MTPRNSTKIRLRTSLALSDRKKYLLIAGGIAVIIIIVVLIILFMEKAEKGTVDLSTAKTVRVHLVVSPE